MELSTGDVVADKYRIEHLVGEGGMGTVYAATNMLTGRVVALKWLRGNLAEDDIFTQRFMREARVGGRLDHPSIVNVFDVGKHGGSVFLVMELLRGEPFDEWLRRGEHTPTECIARLMPALRAIHAAHDFGVVHRDLKPENIYLCKDADGTIRQTKVLDFGIAKEVGALASPDSSKSLTSPGSLVGTIHYMAPEQVRNSRFADKRSDVYSLGVILYHALGGGLPFDAESIGELIIDIVQKTPEPLEKRNPELSPKVVEIVMKAMARDPADRYQSVAHLARALEPHSGGVRYDETLSGPFSAAPISVPPPTRKTIETTMASAMPAHPTLVDSHRPGRSLVLVPTLIGVAIAGLLAIKVGTWMFAKDEPKPPVESPAAAAHALEPAPPVAPVVGESPTVMAKAPDEKAPDEPTPPAPSADAVPVVTPAPMHPSKTPSASAKVAPRGDKKPAAAPPSVVPTPPPAPAPPATPAAPAQKTGPGFVYERNPYKAN